MRASWLFVHVRNEQQVIPMKFIHSAYTIVCTCCIVASLSLAGCRSAHQSIDVDGNARHYLLRVPEGISQEQPVPLVLALHQFLDTPEGMRDMTGLDALADSEKFIVVYPKGRWRRWNAVPDADNPDIRFLLALIHHLCAVYPVDENRIYATGASAGAMMIQALAQQENCLAAIAPVMGSLGQDIVMDAPTPNPVPVFVIHGLEDPVIPYAGGVSGDPRGTVFLSAEATAAYWAGASGCNDLPVVQDEDGRATRFTYACGGNLEVLLLAVEGCGHSWPGHQSRFPRCIVGPSVPQPQATLLIWGFFSRHSLDEDKG